VRELQHVVEQAAWRAETLELSMDDLPNALRSSNATMSTKERRRGLGDQLFDALVQGQYSFWDHVHPLFLERDLTRHDLRELVGRGLQQTKGNYRAVLRLFGLPDSDYYRFHNFLTAHGCKVDYRIYRTGAALGPSRPQALSRAS
jgi:transcriptional regulator of acetoin/glycerol metabolism